MHIGKHVLEDLDISNIHVGTLTPWGAHHFQSGFQTPSSSLSELRRRQIPLFVLRKRAHQPLRDGLVRSIQEDIVPHVGLLEDAVDPTQDTRIHEAVQQIYWSKTSYGKCLNTQHLLLTAMLVWKTLIIPGLSVAAPLLAVIMPFIILRFLEGNSSVTMWEYAAHVKRTVLQQVNVPAALRPKHEGDVFGYVLETLFLGITCLTFVTSIWNQIQSALHLRSIAADIHRRGEAIQSAVRAAHRILTDLTGLPKEHRRGLRRFLTEGERVLQPFSVEWRPLAAYGFAWNTPAALRDLLAWIGQLDVWLAISRLDGICMPRFLSTSVSAAPIPHLDIRALYHPSLPLSKRVTNTVHIGVPSTLSNHVLLTGPNRGGKSTFCRAFGLAVLVAQTWGFAWARTMTFAPYTVMVTALRPTDTLGRLSLFESEIEFARDVLEQARTGGSQGPMFVMMDEIFHSTNAHDGFEATRVFLQQLYDVGPHVTSLISTHYRGLTDVFVKHVVPWALEARGEESLEYTYRVIPGVSNKSSVMEILRERGLVVTA